MTASDRSTDPGPGWWWASAWSLQGLGVVGVHLVGLSSDAARFALTGAVAGLPLLALFWLLRRRGDVSPDPR